MSKSAVAAMAVIVSCVACGDSKTGKFVDSAVRGLHYASKSGSGLTDGDGTFAYDDGESVTFSLGGITLGSAKGADRITPFDLFGIQPPATEAEALAAMSDRRGVDDFDRAANVVFFLVALDRDQEPANGIDLTGWHETLATATLSFDRDASVFTYEDFEVFARRYDGIIRPSATKPLTHFYASNGISVSAHVPITYFEDNGDDGIYESKSYYAYDERGRASISRYDSDGDGVDDQRTEQTYDAAGAPATYVQSFDNDGDGIFESYSRYTYTHDERGNETQEVYEQALDNVVTSRTTTNATFTARNAIESDVTESDVDADGSVDSRITRRLRYAANGDREERRVETDSDADGSADRVVVDTYGYDIAGRVIMQRTTTDDDANGTTDTSRERSYTYDERGTATFEERTDYDATGTLTSRVTYRYELGSDGFRTATRYISDADGDGVDDSTILTTYEHDADGNYTVYLTTTDTDADGTADRISRQTYTYGPFGQALTSLSENDEDADGVYERRSLFSSSYDELGYYTHGAFEYDNDGDGIYEDKSTTVQTYDVIADGVYVLLYNSIAD